MRVVDVPRPRAGAGGARTRPGGHADGPVHDTVALAADLRRHLSAGLRHHRGLRAGFAPLLSRVPDAGTTQAALAEALALSDQAVSGTIALAVDAGFVRRVPHPDDGRAKLVVPTARGRRLAAESAALIAARLDAHAAVVGGPRAAALVERFGALYRALGRGPGTDASGAPLRAPDAFGTVVPVAAAAVRDLHDAVVRAGHPEVRRAHATVLLRLEAPGARPTSVARALGTSRQSAGAALLELEALGYVRRGDDGDDRRAVVFAPTARASRFLDAWASGARDIAARWHDALGDERWDDHVRDLRDLRASLPAPAEAEAPGDPATTPDALDRLATDLVQRLGITDARALAHLLTERTASPRSNRRTRPTKEAST